MALLTKYGILIIGPERNANANMTNIKSAKKRKFIVDRSAINKRELNKLAKLAERIEIRKAIEKMKREL